MPTYTREAGYIFKTMCAGGVIDGVVYNVVTEPIIMFKTGVLLKSYAEVCPVKESLNYSMSFKNIFQKMHVYMGNVQQFIIALVDPPNTGRMYEWPIEHGLR